MPRKNADLHGNAPDKCAVALLIIDVVNDLEFPDNKEILRSVVPMSDCLSKLKERTKKLRIPVIYVNDNFGKWRSDFRQQVNHCLRDEVSGKGLVEKLAPEARDYFVLKPKHSGFFSSTLEILLTYLETKTLILTGIAGDRCVLFTANDAFLRDYKLFVPADCVVSNHQKQNREALQLMKRVLKADIRRSNRIPLEQLKKGPPPAEH
jgi:nicotinamidase-related amidase